MIKSKKIISIAAAAALAFSAFAISGCGEQDYKGEKVENYQTSDPVSSQGGFVVEKGDYVYFINGKESNTADNTYGEVVKGALMRVSKADLAAGKGDQATMVVPSLFVSGNYDSGIFIHGDYVYYATPTTDKDNSGSVANTSLDFKRAKIDGSDAPMDGKNEYFFRLSSNSVKYRFVEDNGTVYCMYEDSGALKSYNVSTGTTTVLVSGASNYYYDTDDLKSPVVYYTMSVSQDIDKAKPSTQPYNQIFSVRAGNYADVDKKEASYKAKTATGEVVAEYNFDQDYMKANEEDKGYDLEDYTTYPYVNLGELVLDGIGTGTDEFPGHVVMTEEEKAFKNQAEELQGFTYTIQKQANGGLYFTRKAIISSTKESLHYISNARTNWNPITGNAKGNTQTVSKDTTNAGSSAIFLLDGTEHTYIYTEDSILKKTKTNENGEVVSTVKMEHGVSSVTLWKVDGEYLYYYATGTNGQNLTRINYKGEQSDYDFLGDEKAYDPVTLPYVDWNDSWYKPEFVKVNGETVLMFAGAQSFGSTSTAYNYIYATKIGTNEEITAQNEKIEEINEYIGEYSSNSALQNLMKCYFQTNSAMTFDSDETVNDLYTTYQKEQFKLFQDKFGEDEDGNEKEFEGVKQSDLLSIVGKMNDDDIEEIENSWANYLLHEDEEEEEEGLSGWEITLIVVGSVLFVALAVGIPTAVVLKKKKARKKQQEAIVSAYKRNRIDTTDDKSIDVYADDDEEEKTEKDEANADATEE